MIITHYYMAVTLPQDFRSNILLQLYDIIWDTNLLCVLTVLFLLFYFVLKSHTMCWGSFFTRSRKESPPFIQPTLQVEYLC